MPVPPRNVNDVSFEIRIYEMVGFIFGGRGSIW